jgi:aryl-alcohol dehydrogenase-like predicted oxidoreductase
VARRFGMGIMAWSPLAGGWLTGKYRAGAAPVGSRAARGREFDPGNARLVQRYDLSAPANRAKARAVDQLAKLAAQSGIPLAGLALAFAGSHPAVSSVLIGPRTLRQLEELLALTGITLDGAVLDEIDRIAVSCCDHYSPADERLRPHRFVPVEGVVQLGVALVATKSVTGQIVVVDAAERFGLA